MFAQLLTTEKQSKRPIKEVLSTLQTMPLVFILLRDPEISDLFQRTNTRIYRLL
jgi:hypothetical protein